MTKIPGLLAALCLLCAAPAAARDVAAVLAKGTGPYFETYLAFQRAMGRPVTPFDLSEDEKPRLPSGLKVAVSFGSKAAALKYPAGTTVVFTLAPGYIPGGGAKYRSVATLPDPALALPAYKRLQPGLRRLTVFHLKGSMGPYLMKISSSATGAGVEVNPVSLSSPDEFPEKLREMTGRADAFWLLSDPPLINRESMMILSKFSCSNRIPFYAPTAGLLRLGATAAFGPDFGGIGGAAAAAVKKALAGEELPEVTYVENPGMSVNLEAAEKCGFPLAKEVFPK
ncbi:MAG: ABC transporter substrate-binding protein [Elusimicrobia bacterium]|nr:MAG: ABC transporter substrate-binding protein [Elusimicrobiota bacterium]KAF0153683.1 MAG: ABC transporter substrate-binding protein [Elusimicrobiota bacterium]